MTVLSLSSESKACPKHYRASKLHTNPIGWIGMDWIGMEAPLRWHARLTKVA